jgi:hypothetical protein
MAASRRADFEGVHASRASSRPAEGFESLAALEGLQAELVLQGHGEPWREGVAAAAQNARQVGRS